jgi:hypothetical protein
MCHWEISHPLPAAASENQVITKKEFKTLLKTAKEPV